MADLVPATPPNIDLYPEVLRRVQFRADATFDRDPVCVTQLDAVVCIEALEFLIERHGDE